MTQCRTRRALGRHAWRAMLMATLTAGAVAAATAGAAVAGTAQYSVRFDATWSAATHPIDFPNNAHFSPLIGATHRPEIRFWQEGSPASNGIERMAEEGLSDPLAAEVQPAIGAGDADQVLRGGSIAHSPGATELSFAIDEDFPAVTLVSMLAPSPDWFVGVSALSLREGGDWVQEKVVHLVAWDAGTDSGITFRSPDQDTFPPLPVTRIQNGALGNGEYLGTFTFTRTDVEPPPPLALQDGRFLVRVQWEIASGTRGYGHGTLLTPDSGSFWFFAPTNLELLVKALDACTPFGHHWFFAAGLTDVGVEIEVEDTVSGEVRSWKRPIGEPFEPILDTTTFPHCP